MKHSVIWIVFCEMVNLRGPPKISYVSLRIPTGDWEKLLLSDRVHRASRSNEGRLPVVSQLSKGQSDLHQSWIANLE